MKYRAVVDVTISVGFEAKTKQKAWELANSDWILHEDYEVEQVDCKDLEEVNYEDD